MSLFALCVNGVASTLFISTHMVDWRYVLPMAIAAVIGGYGAAGVARRIGRVAVRRFVIGVGFAMSLILFFRYFSGDRLGPGCYFTFITKIDWSSNATG